MGKKPNGEVTDHQCEICEKYYHNEATLWTNKKNMHEDKIVTSFQCEFVINIFEDKYRSIVISKEFTKREDEN